MEAINGNITHVKEYTPEQKEKIQQLRERVGSLLRPDLDDDNYLIRWLIARRYDVDQAEEMLKKHIRFSKVHGLFELHPNNQGFCYTPPEPTQYFFTTMLGYDKEGSVVRILHVGASDLRGLCMSLSKIDSIKYASYILFNDEAKQKEERKNDTINEKSIYIIDLQGLSWRTVIQRIVVERAFAMLRAYEANYPERLKVAYIVNVPSFFSFIYNWLKTVLPETIISKIEILSGEECQEKLATLIDPEILPASLGGNRRDPDGDENCRSLYAKPLGEPVPEKFLPVDQLQILKNDPLAIRIVVDYKATFIAEKHVPEAYSTLIWDFQTTDYDIRMGLRYKRDENSEVEDIIPIHRVECHIIPESGRFMVESPGIYEFVFDNSYSWMTSKELFFKINLIPPSKEEISN